MATLLLTYVTSRRLVSLRPISIGGLCRATLDRIGRIQLTSPLQSRSTSPLYYFEYVLAEMAVGAETENFRMRHWLYSADFYVG